MNNYIAALRRRREETGESGFSLIELIIVVVILGILAAIAVPVFLGLQDQAKTSTLETVTANGASQAAADLAQGVAEATIQTNLTALAGQSEDQLDGITLSIEPKTSGEALTVDNFCVSGAAPGVNGGDSVTSGPGC